MFSTGIGLVIYLVYGFMLGAGAILLLLAALGQEMFPPTKVLVIGGGVLVAVPVLLFVASLVEAG